VGIVILGIYPNLIFKITDPAVVQSLSAFAGH
jgi:NADH:ubiquinone oxidoreductase subunit 4 (subunit M)